MQYVNLASSTSLPIVSTTCQRLEHSAARDRIAVKNKRRQAIKEKVYDYYFFNYIFVFVFDYS
jgi:hypothetical protein